jgi:hypothetical protein
MSEDPAFLVRYVIRHSLTVSSHDAIDAESSPETRLTFIIH